MNDSTQSDGTHGAHPDLPECLQPGGELDTILDGTRSAAQRKGSTSQLHDELRRTAGNLRLGPSQPGLDRFENVVLRYCVARQQGERTHEQQAQEEYRSRKDEYDLILGDFIPEDLRREAAAYLARRAYLEHSNTTAAADWGVFMQMQQPGRCEALLGMPTGLAKLDEMIGGLRGLVFLGGDKGTGKTSLALFMVLATLRARPDVAALFYSLDMSKTRIYERLLCCEAGIDYRTLRDLQKSPEQEQCLNEADERLRQEILPRLRVVERDFANEEVIEGDRRRLVRRGITFDRVLQDCRNLMDSSGARHILIVVDLFQKMDPPGDVAEGAAADHYRLDLLDIVHQRSCSPSRPHGFPILVTSEIRKDAPKGNLSRDDLKGSGRIASDADVVLLMWPDESDNNTTGDIVPTTVRIGKGREGVIRTDVKLWFQHTCFQFHDEEPTVSADNLVHGNKKDSSADASHQTIDPLGD